MIKISNVSKSYKENHEVLSRISFDINDKELIVLLGESGCGKTTLLKIINRLEKATSGEIEIDGQNIIDIDPVKLRRKIGYVVQQVGLFPHMIVKENLEIVCKIKKEDEATYSKQILQMLKMVGLDADKFLYRYPSELSGGQAQRIGVARAYMANSDLILMDEPFSALDPITRNELQDELLRLQHTYPKTIVFVTHDITEAIKIADRIVLLNKGKIEQIGTPRELLINPKSEYVSKFLGEKRIWNSPWLIQCRDVMSTKLSCVKQSEHMKIVWDMFRQDKIQTILVIDENGKAVGKLTEKILMRNIDVNSIDQVMKKSFDYVFEKTSLHDAVRQMNEKNILYMPVLDKNMRPTGMINMTDLMKIFDSNVLSTTVEV